MKKLLTATIILLATTVATSSFGANKTANASISLTIVPSVEASSTTDVNTTVNTAYTTNGSTIVL